MKEIVSVDPFRCRLWRFHDRIEDHIDEQTCRDEIRSFEEHGQLVPVLGRRIRDSDHDVELIYGARRLFVARHLNLPLLVEIRALDDRAAMIAMDLENRQRKDISPYERGLSYARCLRANHFASQEELARVLGVSASQVSRLLRLARLPTVIVSAFEKATDICEGWGLALADEMEKPESRSRAIKAARAIAAEKPRHAAVEVYRLLLASAAGGRQMKARKHDRVVKHENGQPLFRVRYQRTAIALLLPVGKVSASSLERIESAIESILSKEGVGVPERNSRREAANGLNVSCSADASCN